MWVGVDGCIYHNMGGCGLLWVSLDVHMLVGVDGWVWIGVGGCGWVWFQRISKDSFL